MHHSPDQGHERFAQQLSALDDVRELALVIAMHTSRAAKLRGYQPRTIQASRTWATVAELESAAARHERRASLAIERIIATVDRQLVERRMVTDRRCSA